MFIYMPIFNHDINGPIFICAGEPSGDLYAAHLIELIKKDNQKIKFYGIGGSRMARSGVEILGDYQGMSMMTFGFSAGLAGIASNHRTYRKIRYLIRETRPETFIAVAYPGVNLPLCKYARSHGAIVYYVMPPQIWAWGRFRKFFLKKWVDLVISLFPFEHRFLHRFGIHSILLENPLRRELQKYRRRDHKKRIGFMPGSRPGMIKRNMPVIIALVEAMKKTNAGPETEYILIIPPYISQFHFQLLNPGPFSISYDHYQAMRDCDLLVTCSGTASLEAAFMDIPQVFFHRPSFFDYYIARRFIRLKEYNLANLYFETKITTSYICRSIKDLVALLTKHMI
jgi:lipid-A-disaccharide synthase